jgi:hypothetical protein
MNTSANYEEIRPHLLQLTEAERRKLLEEVNQSIPAQAATESRSLQLRWLADRANREKYGGQYVALRGDELIAHSTNSQEVIALAKAAELSPLFIAWVEPPTDDAATLIGWH